MRMKKLNCGRTLERFCLFSGTTYSCCLCLRSKNNNKNNNGSADEIKPLIVPSVKATPSSVKLKDVISGPPTLAFQLKPKIVVLRVSMHCNGCARKVEKHISKLEGVTSYQVDLETKMVVVTGDIVPFEVLESVSKVKNAELWNNQY
ncbi:Copper chaperone [Handroanthus impetiginosus]|uniref:Copper chaperone n=1 Tax=Handroanthus impetiginosus TaxID=429701 RepID=A0A2G9GC00_9LAMI|nr:Copper chaperone [Handroanthus impetiginosus]